MTFTDTPMAFHMPTRRPLSIGLHPVDEMTAEDLITELEWLNALATLSNTDGSPRGLCGNEKMRCNAIRMELHERVA